MSEERNLELLPQGAFVINRGGGQKIKGRFSMYVLDRFCVSRKIESYITLLERITLGMSVGDYADLILMALEDYFRNNPSALGLNKADVCDIIDERLNGVAGADFGQLVRHAIGRVADVKKVEEVAMKLTGADLEEKKSESNKDSSEPPSGKEPGSVE